MRESGDRFAGHQSAVDGQRAQRLRGDGVGVGVEDREVGGAADPDAGHPAP